MIYLLHFQRAYQHAQHYLGFVATAAALQRRIAQHEAGQGARLMQVIALAGIPFEVAATWDGDRTTERRFKNRKNARKLCPVCRAAAQARRARAAEGRRCQGALPFESEVTCG